MKRIIAAGALLLPLLLVGCSVSVDRNGISLDNCRYDRSHTKEVAVDGAKSLRLDGWTGSLTIRGKEGATVVHAEGKACSSDAKLLDQISLKAEKSGDAINLQVVHPDRIGMVNAYMDLTIDLPANMIATVDKNSGSVLIENIAGLDVTKGSGDLEVRTIKGDLRVKTNSGSAKVTDVTGATTYEGGSGDLVLRNLKDKVTIQDKNSGTFTAEDLGGDFEAYEIGSGDMTLVKVAGTVNLHNKNSGTVRVEGASAFTGGRIGSGDLTIKQVAGDVTLQEKASGSTTISDVSKNVSLFDLGSGSLNVSRVKGDLTVKSKASGSVSYADVQGKVDVPHK